MAYSASTPTFSAHSATWGGSGLTVTVQVRPRPDALGGAATRASTAEGSIPNGGGTADVYGIALASSMAGSGNTRPGDAIGRCLAGQAEPALVSVPAGSGAAADMATGDGDIIDEILAAIVDGRPSTGSPIGGAVDEPGGYGLSSAGWAGASAPAGVTAVPTVGNEAEHGSAGPSATAGLSARSANSAVSVRSGGAAGPGGAVATTSGARTAPVQPLPAAPVIPTSNGRSGHGAPATASAPLTGLAAAWALLGSALAMVIGTLVLVFGTVFRRRSGDS